MKVSYFKLRQEGGDIVSIFLSCVSKKVQLFCSNKFTGLTIESIGSHRFPSDQLHIQSFKCMNWQTLITEHFRLTYWRPPIIVILSKGSSKFRSSIIYLFGVKKESWRRVVGHEYQGNNENYPHLLEENGYVDNELECLWLNMSYFWQ